MRRGEKKMHSVWQPALALPYASAGGSRRLCLLFQIPAAAVVRLRMGIHRRGLQVGMAERLRDKRDRRAVVDSVRGMCVTQPMRRRCWIDASTQSSSLYDVVKPRSVSASAR